MQLPTAVSSSVRSARNLFPVPSQHSTPGIVAPVVSTGIGGVSATLTPSNVSAVVQVVPSLPGSVGPTVPTAAVSGQMPVPVSEVSLTVPTPSVGTTAILSAPAVVANPAVVTIPPPMVVNTVASVALTSQDVVSMYHRLR